MQRAMHSVGRKRLTFHLHLLPQLEHIPPVQTVVQANDAYHLPHAHLPQRRMGAGDGQLFLVLDFR